MNTPMRHIAAPSAARGRLGVVSADVPAPAHPCISSATGKTVVTESGIETPLAEKESFGTAIAELDFSTSCAAVRRRRVPT